MENILLPKVIIFFQIVFIDIVMAADNAIIIGLIASSFAKTDRKKIILFGIFGAFIFRIIFAAITVQLLQFPILKVLGGTLLIWIIVKLIKDLELIDALKTTKQQTPKPKKPPSFASAVYSVIIADVTLSFDNVLGVAAAARNEMALLVFGLLLSVLLVGTVATFFANYIRGHKWVGVLGLFVILIVALQLILGGTNEFYPNVLPEFLIKIV
jgi:YjbE family integral membrane protein